MTDEQEKPDNNISRRKFFTLTARVGLIGGLVAGGVALLSRSGQDDSQARCDTGPCETCQVRNDCSLPQAQKRRKDTAKQ